MEEMHQRYKKNENIVFRTINDEAILVPIKSNVADMGFIYNLNEVGAFVWEHLDGERQLADIQTIMLDEFEVDPEEAEKDLRTFVNQLKEVEAVVEVS